MPFCVFLSVWLHCCVCIKKKKGYLSASLFPWRTFDIHENFSIHKRFFLVEKKKVKSLFFRTAHWMIICGIKNGSSILFLWKPQPLFLRVKLCNCALMHLCSCFVAEFPLGGEPIHFVHEHTRIKCIPTRMLQIMLKANLHNINVKQCVWVKSSRG